LAYRIIGSCIRVYSLHQALPNQRHLRPAGPAPLHRPQAVHQLRRLRRGLPAGGLGYPR